MKQRLTTVLFTAASLVAGLAGPLGACPPFDNDPARFCATHCGGSPIYCNESDPDRVCYSYSPGACGETTDQDPCCGVGGQGGF